MDLPHGLALRAVAAAGGRGGLGAQVLPQPAHDAADLRPHQAAAGGCWWMGSWDKGNKAYELNGTS